MPSRKSSRKTSKRKPSRKTSKRKPSRKTSKRKTSRKTSTSRRRSTSRSRKTNQTNISKKDIIYMMKGLHQSYKNNWVKFTRVIIYHPDPKILDIVERVLVKQGTQSKRLSADRLKIYNLNTNSYIYLGIIGHYVRWMEPYFK